MMKILLLMVLISMPMAIQLLIDKKVNPEKYIDQREVFCKELWWKVISEYGWLLDGSTYYYCLVPDKENMKINKIPLNYILHLK